MRSDGNRRNYFRWLPFQKEKYSETGTCIRHRRTREQAMSKTLSVTNQKAVEGRNQPMIQRPPLPPFTRETAIQKVRLAEDAWNSRDPEKVALAYTVDSRWRNRSEFVNGRQE